MGKATVERGSAEEAELARALLVRVAQKAQARDVRGVDEACCVRFLRARSHCARKAEALLADSIEWRSEARPERLRWGDVEREMKTGKMYRTPFRALDGLGTIVMRPRNENTKDHDGQIRNLTYLLENAAASLAREEAAAGRGYPHPQRVEKFRWLIDFQGYSIRNAPPMKTSRETLALLQGKFPERLGQAVLWDPPRLFYAFWRLISPFVDKRTRAKVIFCFPGSGGKSKGDAGSELLQRLYTPEQLAALGLDPSGARLEGSYDHAAYAAWMCAEDALKVTDQPVAPDAEGDVFFDCVGNCLVEGDGSHIGFS